MLSNFLDHCQYQMNPQIVNGDFERAIIDAFYTTFPNIRFQGCIFHYSNALNRNIQKHGLQTEYCNNIHYRKWFHLFTSLPFLPPSAVPYGLNYIKMLSQSHSIELQTNSEQNIFNAIHKDSRIQSFIRYFESTWMGRERSDLTGPQPKALYTIQEWNHLKNTSPRTNNHAEGLKSFS